MRTLHKEHGYVAYQTGTGVVNQESYFEDFFGTTKGEWVKIGLAANNCIMSEQYIDLNGLNIDDKSVFFDAITCQSPNAPLIGPKVFGAANPPAGASLLIHDIVTSVPLIIENSIIDELAYGIGYMQSQYDFEHVIYYRSQSWTTDVDFGGFICNMTSQQQSGSGMPTASDRLYCYRFVQWTTQVQNAVVSIPPARIVLAARAVKENEVEYIYRLKRSYELQQSFDRD
tara:strand:+ start:567 stop:1250 length:684 start_codon:yes stop_codon:yes gene_type:complete